MRKRRFNRFQMVMSIIAMLGAMVELPTAATAALAVALVAPAKTHAAADQTTHKSCAHCPKKACPDLGACLAKCFQILYSAVAKNCLPRLAVASRLAPAPSLLVTGKRIPPPFRPPST
jgi:hypothetical protein